MLAIQSIDGRDCPVIVCDICGGKLDNASKAAAVFQNFVPDGAELKVLHVHKGSIDGRTCRAQADALLGKDGAAVGWQEMATHLADLAHNAGFPATEMAKHEEGRLRFDV